MSRHLNKAHVREALPSTIQHVKLGFLTTGDMSFFCRVAMRTVGKWCDQGLVTNYKVVNNTAGRGNHRRIKVRDAIKFMREYNYDMHPLLKGSSGIWVIEWNRHPETLQPVFPEGAETEHLTIIQALMKSRDSSPEFIVLSPTVDNCTRNELIDTLNKQLAYLCKWVVVVDDSYTDDDIRILNVKYPSDDVLCIRQCEVNWRQIFSVKATNSTLFV